MELIELKTAIDAAKGKSEHTDIIFDTATESEIVYMLRSLPTVDAVPVVHGKWIYNTDDFDPKIRCSCCNYNKPMIASDGGIPMVFSLPKYCEMCGALMDGKAE